MKKVDFSISWNWVRERLIKLEKVPLNMHTCLDECLDEARHLAKPKKLAIKKAVSAFRPESPSLISCIKGATHIIVFLVTIGKKVEEKATYWMDKDEGLRGYLLDRIGSLAVESLAEQVEESLRAKYEPENLSVSMRFSPGYCDWPIEEQFKISKMLDFSKIGVILTKSCMMVPKKSISAIVAIGPKGTFSSKVSPCSICDRKDCDYRRGL